MIGVTSTVHPAVAATDESLMTKFSGCCCLKRRQGLAACQTTTRKPRPAELTIKMYVKHVRNLRSLHMPRLQSEVQVYHCGSASVAPGTNETQRLLYSFLNVMSDTPSLDAEGLSPPRMEALSVLGDLTVHSQTRPNETTFVC